jgi:serine phosphatase RsbU (regulator of sigma subunit)
MIFVTAAYTVIHLGFSKLRYAQAGHPTPLHWDQSTRTMRPVSCPPNTAGPALGLMDEFEFVASEESVAAGDRVVLFTDGVFEAAAPDGEEFGPERLAATLAAAEGKPLDATLETLLGEVSKFCGSEAFQDDVCVVAVELTQS